MNWQGIEQEIGIFARGLVAALAAALLTTLASYFGAHLGTLLNDIVVFLGGYAGVKSA